MSSLLLGISAVPSKYLLTTLQATNAPTLYMFRAALIGIFALFLFRQPVIEYDLKTFRIIFIRSLFVIGQWILLYYALTLGSAGVAVTLGNITPVFVLALGSIFLKERLDWKKGLAAVAILIISFML
jgi:drug/metabolite transporter (DMT)-like permease